MDENSMAYFSQQLNIRPHVTSSLAIAYVKSLLGRLKRASSFGAGGIKPLINMLTNVGRIEVEQNKSIQRDAVADEQDDPAAIVDRINNLGRAEAGVQGGGGDGKAGKDSKQRGRGAGTAKERMWPAKVARYLAWCVDGGLLQSKFTIQTMIQFAEKVTDPEEEALIQREIAYLLHLRDKD